MRKPAADGDLRAVSVHNVQGVFAPIAGTVAAVALAVCNHGVSTTALELFAAFYVLTALGLELGFHRLFTHRAFRCGPTLRVVLGIAGSMACEGPVIFWASIHRDHHRFTDTGRDPHTPLPAGWRGFWKAHVGWMPRVSPPAVVGTGDLARDRATRFVDRTFGVWIALGLAAPCLIGGVLGGAGGALESLLWGGFVRIAACHQVTWCLNSVAHLAGERPYATRDGSRNVWLLALPTMGAAWHNNHHAFPASATNDHRWWQVDPTAWVVRALARAGLIWDVRANRAARHRAIQIVG